VLVSRPEEARTLKRHPLASFLVAVFARLRRRRQAPLPPTRHARRIRLD
jgi:hypothetical protein